MAEENKRQRRRARRMERREKNQEEKGIPYEYGRENRNQLLRKIGGGQDKEKARKVLEDLQAQRDTLTDDTFGNETTYGRKGLVPGFFDSLKSSEERKTTRDAQKDRLDADISFIQQMMGGGTKEKKNKKKEKSDSSFAEAVEDAVAGQQRRGLEGALSGAADKEEPLIIDDSKFEDPEDEEPEKIDFVEDYEPSGVPLIGVEDIDVSEPTLRAEPVPEMDEAESGRLFKMIMGSSFDPVSSMDKGKMEILKKAKAENPDLTDSQLALKIYRDYM